MRKKKGLRIILNFQTRLKIKCYSIQCDPMISLNQSISLTRLINLTITNQMFHLSKEFNYILYLLLIIEITLFASY